MAFMDPTTAAIPPACTAAAWLSSVSTIKLHSAPHACAASGAAAAGASARVGVVRVRAGVSSAARLLADLRRRRVHLCSALCIHCVQFTVLHCLYTVYNALRAARLLADLRRRRVHLKRAHHELYGALSCEPHGAQLRAHLHARARAHTHTDCSAASRMAHDTRTHAHT